MEVITSSVIIALDDGHGDNGVTAGKRTPMFPAGSKYAGKFMYENSFNKVVVSLLSQHLTRHGFKVLFTAPTDADTPLKARTDLANNTIKNQYNCPADLFISVHANAMSSVWGNSGGIETFVYTGQCNKESGLVAKSIHKRLLQGTPLTDRHVKEADFHVLRETHMEAVLVECAFMDNLYEAELLMSDSYRQECAIEIAKGICDYYCVTWIDEKPCVSTPAVPTSSDPQATSLRKLLVGTNDVFMDKWYVDAVKFAIDEKLMSTNDGAFNPDQPLTRAMFAQVLLNLRKGGKI